MATRKKRRAIGAGDIIGCTAGVVLSAMLLAVLVTVVGWLFVAAGF